MTQPQLQTAPNAGLPPRKPITTDPPVSEAQRRAMWAAKEGRSTLGIPKSVGEKFVGHGHDEEDDTTRAAGVALRDPDGRLLFVRRAHGDQAGTWAFPGGYARRGEAEEAAAIRELNEELSFLLSKPLRVTLDEANGGETKFTTFLHNLDEVPDIRLDNESSGYVWAHPHELPQPLHPGVDATFEKIRSAVSGKADDPDALAAWIKRKADPGWNPAADAKLFFIEHKPELLVRFTDDKFAFDESVRSLDADGRLHVSRTPISKANVCPYLGSEIPDYQSLGLKPDRIYQLLRHPEELKKAADSFNNLQVLIKHVPVNVEDHQPDETVGSTGTDAEYVHPYLYNSLVVWAKDAVDGINSNNQKELSSAYRYRADMTPGNYEGADYDGIMRDIVGNHVALVKEGRAGSDVVVGDSKESIITHEQKEKPMLSRKAVLAQGALMVALRSKLAQDAQLPDLAPILKDVTAKNYVEKKPSILEGLKTLLKDVKLAKDAKLDDMHEFLDSLDKEEPAHDEEPEPKPPTVDEDLDDKDKKKPFGLDAEQSEGLKNFLKEKGVGEDTIAALDNWMHGRDAAGPPEFEGKPAKPPGAADAALKGNKEKAMVDDKQVADIVKVATDAAIKTQQDIREAEREVRPWVGELAMAHDSAAGVYRTALKILGIDAKDVHDSALPHILKVQPKPGETKEKVATVAMDAAGVDAFHKRIPGAARIGLLG